ncbi:Cupin 1 - like 10 [Theobroma cacao]|nr:Cupin 1 - like 10 [Theobroma cacao]
MNGKFCKDLKLATAEDFLLSRLNVPRNTVNLVGSVVTPVNVDQILGLNTLGISLVCIDYAPNGGINPPQTYPHPTDPNIGFVTFNPDNCLISKVFNLRDVFVFPIGLIHFQQNVRKTNVVAFTGLSSQNPEVITVANAVFGYSPPIDLDVLTRVF